MSQPQWLTEEEQKFWRLLISADRAIHKSIDDTLQNGHGLSSTDFAVLASISEEEKDTVRLRDLCANLSWDRSRASHQVTRMEKRGLLTKTPSPGDARGVILNITEEGKRRVEQAAPDHVNNVREIIFDQLTEEEIAIIKNFLFNVLEVTKGSRVPGTPHK